MPVIMFKVIFLMTANKNERNYENMNYKNLKTNSEDNIEFKKILKSLNRIEGVKDCLFIDLDGIPISDVDYDGTILGVTSLAALAALREMMKTVNYGNLEQLIIKTDQGNILVQEISEKQVLVIITSPQTNLGLIRSFIKKFNEKNI